MNPASSRSLLFLLFLARALGDCINTVAGLSAGPAAASAYSSPQGVAVRGDGTLVFAAQNAVFAQQDDAGVVALAGRPLQKGFAGDGGPAGLALLSGPRGVLYLPEVDALLIADAGNARICILFFSSGIVDTLAGTGAPGNGGDGGSPLLASFTAPQALAAHPASGDIFVADLDGVCVRRLRYGGRAAAWSNRSGGIIDTFLGTGGVVVGDSLLNCLAVLLHVCRPCASPTSLMASLAPPRPRPTHFALRTHAWAAGASTTC